MIREIPEPGDVGLTNIVGPVGWGIRAGQWMLGDGFGMYEHAFLVLGDGMLIEAEPDGAVIRPLSEYDGRHVLYVSPAGLSQGERDAIVEAARRYEGVGYSAMDYFALAAHRFHLPLPWLRRFVSNSGHMICSQLVDQAYIDASVHLYNDGRWPGYVTPADLYMKLA